MSDWEHTTWGAVSDLRYGKALRGYKGGTGQCSVYASAGLVGRTDNQPLGMGPRPIVGRKGTLGVHLATGPFWVIDTAFWLEPKSGLDPIWAFQMLRTVDWKSLRSGSSLPSLSRDHFYDLGLLLPPLDEQERIAGVLGAFDDLIETNRRVAGDLDALVALTVSDALRKSEVQTRLTAIASFVNGRNFTRGADGSGRPVIRTPEVRSGPLAGTVRNSLDVKDEDRLARPGDVLFVWSGTLMVNRWRHEEGLVNQHVFKVIPDGVPSWYVYSLIQAQMTWFLGLAKDKATTMGHIKRADLDEPLTGLSEDEINRLDPTIAPLWDASLELQMEADELTRQRDELLPLLMSGKVRVSELEEVV